MGWPIESNLGFGQECPCERKTGVLRHHDIQQSLSHQLALLRFAITPVTNIRKGLNGNSYKRVRVCPNDDQ